MDSLLGIVFLAAMISCVVPTILDCVSDALHHLRRRKALRGS